MAIRRVNLRGPLAAAAVRLPLIPLYLLARDNSCWSVSDRQPIPEVGDLVYVVLLDAEDSTDGYIDVESQFLRGEVVWHFVCRIRDIPSSMLLPHVRGYRSREELLVSLRRRYNLGQELDMDSLVCVVGIRQVDYDLSELMSMSSWGSQESSG
jgi:hypothetical protein